MVCSGDEGKRATKKTGAKWTMTRKLLVGAGQVPAQNTTEALGPRTNAERKDMALWVYNGPLPKDQQKAKMEHRASTRFVFMPRPGRQCYRRT